MEDLANYPVTIGLVIVTVLISYQGFNNRGIVDKLKHWPVAENQGKEFYRFLSSGFVHGSWLHLGINMFVFYEFGRFVELVFVSKFGPTFGHTLFLLVYLSIIVLADLPTYFKHKENPSYAAVGASGAVSGIIFIFIIFNPWSTLLLYFIIPMPAIIGGILYLVYSSWASKNSNDGIDHSAHLYGALFGILAAFGLQLCTIGDFISNLQDLSPMIEFFESFNQ